MIGILAQTTQPSVIGPVPTAYIGSIAAITGTTPIVLGFIKPYIAKVPALASIPVIVFTVVIAVALAVVAHALGYLTGSPMELAAAAGLSVLGANGYHIDGISNSLNQSIGSSVAADNSAISAGVVPQNPKPIAPKSAK